MKITYSDGTAEQCSLFVHKHYYGQKSKPWRLLWAESKDARAYVHVDGETHYKSFRTMKDAVEYGKKVYGEIAQRFSD